MSEFEKLVVACRGSVERYVRYKISSKPDSDDILQEVWLAAYMQFDKLKDKNRFRAWVIGIARNKVNDYYRRLHDDVSIDSLPETELVQSRYGLIEYPMVHDTIDGLNEKDRQILKLYYFESVPQSEIAARLGIPIGTVKSRLNTARHNFKNAYPYPPKGVDTMLKLPKIMPEYRIIPSDNEPFSVKCEQLPGWFIIPKIGEKLTWAIYDQPSRKGDYFYEMQVIGKAEVHGIEGVEINIKESNFDKNTPCTERTFIVQLTDTHCRYLAESHVVDGIKKLYTFLDGDDFLINWGCGEDNCGNEINISPKGIINRTGNIITAQVDSVLDIVGRYNVEVNGRTYDTVCVIEIGMNDENVLSEQFIDKEGKTVLWRRFNRNDWDHEHRGKLWTETLPDNDRLTVNGEVYVHWYDCVSDYIF